MRSACSWLICVAMLCAVSCKDDGGDGDGYDGEPLIQASRVPAFNDTGGYLDGFVRGADPGSHYVAVYLRVDGWWTKPYWDKPRTAIAGDGTWSCDVVTGGVDHRAVGYAAFLLPADYYPPSLGGGDIPSAIYDYALDSTVIVRNANGHSPLERPQGVAVASVDPAGNLDPFTGTATERTVEIRWDYGDRGNVDAFKVFGRDNYGDTLLELATAGGNSNSVSFRHLASGRRCYRVHAVNGVGSSDPSRETCLTFSEIPIAASYVPSGVCFSPFVGGQDPNAGDVLSPEQVHDHVKFLRQYARALRTYGTAGGLARTGEFAHQYAMEVALGAWIGPDLDANRAELDRLLAAAGRGEVDAAVVGSEVLGRGDITSSKLLGYIEEFRAAFPEIPVTTADSYDVLLAHPEVIAACDVIYAHFHPYWAGVYYDDGVYWLDGRYKQLQAACGGKPIVVAETGWPSAGEPQGNAEPSVKHAAFYFKNFVSWARSKNIPFFYFEALDEPWKAAYEPNGVGSHWGILDPELLLKDGFWDVYRGMTLEDNWTRTIPCGPQAPPELTIASVPPYGSPTYGENLEGSTCGVWPENHGLAAYIKTASGWWTKPYLDEAVSGIEADGTFSIDIATEYRDSTATQIAVFLIRREYLPPILEGAREIPGRIFEAALDHVAIDRPPPPQ